MPINYDGRSLVPNLNDALGMALGIAEKRETENKDKARQAEVAGLESELDLSGADPLNNPANLRTVQRMAKLDPQAAQFGLGILKLRSESELQGVQREATEASNFYQAVLDTQDPVERSRFITQAIREREEAGKDTTKLRELVGLTPDKQKLFARRQMILSGDAKLLADGGLAALIQQVDLQNKLLDREQKERDLATGKYADVAAMRDDFTKQSQRFIGVRDAYSSVQAALAEKTKPGDMAAIFAFMKALDPGSSVREGEQASARNAAGVPTQIHNYWNQLQEGTGSLEESQRQEFLKAVRGQFESASRSQDKLKSEFTRLAELRRFNPQEVLVDFSAPAAPQEAAPTPPPMSAARVGEGRVIRDKTTGNRWVVKGGQWQLLGS